MKSEDRLRFGRKNEFVHFILLSTCTTFVRENNRNILSVNEKSRQILSRILIVIFALYYVNICFFYHSHIINGTTIVHSHFHDKAHSQTGTHSESELTLISTLSAFQSTQAPLVLVSLIAIILLLAIIRPLTENKITLEPVSGISSRAPPILLLNNPYTL